MYKNVLIISDNSFLCEKLQSVFLKFEGLHLSFQFSISPFSDKQEFERQLNEEVLVYDLKKEESLDAIINRYDLVFSIHSKQIFPPKMVENVKCINIHPGYNPITRGWYPQVFALLLDLPTGATIHEIDNELDHGNIIAREFVEKEVTDTSESLYNKIIEKEIELVEKHLESILMNTYSAFEPESKGNLFLKEDFKRLCQLNLSEQLTTLEFINRIRALTHGEFKNAFFIDPVSNKKVFVSINLEIEN